MYYVDKFNMVPNKKNIQGLLNTIEVTYVLCYILFPSPKTNELRLNDLNIFTSNNFYE